RALTGGGGINLFGKAIHDPLHTVTHAFWARPLAPLMLKPGSSFS
ncbi:hypothetical protein Pgy4_39008, partial [Pseudomonas savastanoi pv. glycinea str. race 4]